MPNFNLMYYRATEHELAEDEKRKEEYRKNEFERIRRNCRTLCMTCGMNSCPKMHEMDEKIQD